MSIVLGLDTSNYTTSCAYFDSSTQSVKSVKKLLPVKDGEKGLRQSDAVFHHTVQLPELMSQLFDECEETPISVCCSYAPRCVEGSYMPCFLVGKCNAQSISSSMNIDYFETSHQVGHILAALYSCSQLSLIDSMEPFLAFHVSGGTTDLLLCKGDKDKVIVIDEIGHSLDLKAGQAIDRCGVAMGLHFPCGPQLEELALKSESNFKINPTIKGLDCCLSGIENKCMKMIADGASNEDTAKFCITYVLETISKMTELALSQYGNIPVLYAGGVMSDSIIRESLEKRFGGFFAQPQFSCDNAAGIAVYAAIKKGLIL